MWRNPLSTGQLAPRPKAPDVRNKPLQIPVPNRQPVGRPARPGRRTPPLPTRGARIVAARLGVRKV